MLEWGAATNEKEAAETTKMLLDSALKFDKKFSKYGISCTMDGEPVPEYVAKQKPPTA